MSLFLLYFIYLFHLSHSADSLPTQHCKFVTVWLSGSSPLFFSQSFKSPDTDFGPLCWPNISATHFVIPVIVSSPSHLAPPLLRCTVRPHPPRPHCSSTVQLARLMSPELCDLVSTMTEETGDQRGSSEGSWFSSLMMSLWINHPVSPVN